MQRWKMPLKDIQEVALLVENHMLMGCEKWSDAAVRRLISRVGIELIDDLLDLAWADRLAHAPGKSSLRELNTLRFRITEQLRRKPPLQRGDLAINGQDVMRALHLRAGSAGGQDTAGGRAEGAAAARMEPEGYSCRLHHPQIFALTQLSHLW